MHGVHNAVNACTRIMRAVQLTQQVGNKEMRYSDCVMVDRNE